MHGVSSSSCVLHFRFTGEDLSDKLDAVDTVKIRSFHKTLTDAPHIAAGPRDM